MKRLIIVSLSLLAPAAALGADLASKSPAVLRGPSYEEADRASATGVYIGLNAGAGFGDVGRSSQEVLARDGMALDQTRVNLTGPLGGVQVGFALQTGSIVYGLEGDMDVAGMRGTLNTKGTYDTNTTPSVRYDLTDRIQSRLYALGTLRARIGYAFGNTLLYGTAGLASGRYELTESTQAFLPGATTPTKSGTIQTKLWAHGWALGFGGEYAMSRNVSLRLEYLHAHLDRKVEGEPWSHALNLVRTGVNYRF